jgi:glycerophosphoryl diester phosphodiesterase
VPGSRWLAGLDPAAYRDGCVAAARDIGAAWISPEDRMTSVELMGAAHRDELRVAVWTVNDPARMGELAELDVDGIVTDRPDLLIKVLGFAGSGSPNLNC